MKIRVYLEDSNENKIEVFYYKTNDELFTACTNFEYCGLGGNLCEMERY